MSADARRFAATLIAEYVIAENERRGVRMTDDARALVKLEAARVAAHLDEHGALAG